MHKEKTKSVTIHFTETDLKKLRRVAEIKTDNDEAVIKAVMSLALNNHFNNYL